MDMKVSNLMHPGVENGHYQYEVRRDVRVPMRDGVDLLADLRLPVGMIDPRTPTIVVRSPYGRRSYVGAIGSALASHGFPTLVESCRGTFGSGGRFRPQLDEQRDGIDTHRWVR
ncbi:CocE/NonD family hydrolase, partial [Rhizobium johnstonii]|uniref:CocE/NonD family hydrolase n=1 Tax=Rhizobium johnstonii TaxID=3019933 RepID=UPI003F99191E